MGKKWKSLYIKDKMSKKVKYSIYSLRCPKTKEIKYVGSTTKTLYERLCGHIFTPNNKEKKRKDG